MVGDSAVDVAAGVAAGCRTISLKIGVLDPTASFQPDFAAASIGGAAARILENAGRLE